MKKSFSLIEVIIVIIIVGIGIAGMSTAFQTILYQSYRPEAISTATVLALFEAERVVRLDFDNVTDQYRDSPSNYTGNFSGYSYEVRVDSIDDMAPSLGSDSSKQSYKVVEIRVHHSRINYVPLIFLKAKYTS